MNHDNPAISSPNYAGYFGIYVHTWHRLSEGKHRDVKYTNPHWAEYDKIACKFDFKGSARLYRVRLDTELAFYRITINAKIYREPTMSRPSHIPTPATWHRFTVFKNGTSHQLTVQDLTKDMVEPAVDLLTKYFMRDEPPCKYINIHSSPTAVSELQSLWRRTALSGVSLSCVDDMGTLVGVNVLAVSHVTDDEQFQTNDPIWSQLFGAVDALTKSVNVFEMNGVEKYLTAYGLVVDPEWRGLKVGVEILKARIPLCKALGLKVTATVFTAGSSQAVAKKAGFETISEITYEELAKQGYVFPGIEKDTKSSKLMALVIE